MSQSTRTHYPLTYTAETLSDPLPPIHMQERCDVLFTLFQSDPTRPCVAVVNENNKPVGLIDRSQVLRILTHPLHREVYQHLPVSRLLARQFENRFMHVDFSASIDTILDLIARSYPQTLKHGFIITREGQYLGIADPVTLMSVAAAHARSHSQALEEAMHTIQAATEAKTSFINTLSHEMRTPLNSVIAGLQLLQMAETEEESATLLDVTKTAANNLHKLIGDVLDMSKIEAGCMALEEKPYHFKQLIDQIWSAFLPSFLSGNIRAYYVVHPDLPDYQYHDIQKIQQILTNFISNSVKYSQGGDIHLNIYPDPQNPQMIIFDTYDTGGGFPQHIADSLFQPFYQRTNAEQNNQGTGLGLAITRELAQLLKGDVTAFSQEKNQSSNFGGSLFRFHLPQSAVSPDILRDISQDITCPNLAEDFQYQDFKAHMPDYSWQVFDLRDVLTTETYPTVTQPGVFLVAPDYYTPEQWERAILKLLQFTDPECLFMVVLPQNRLDLVLKILPYRRALIWHEIPDRDMIRRQYSFHLFLESHRAQEQSDNIAPENTLDFQKYHYLSGIHALIIDDISANRFILERQLGKFNIHVQQADNAELAALLCERNPFQIILTDIHMPGMSGIEFLREVRQNPASLNRDTPILAVTGEADRDKQSEMMEMGFSDYLLKPIILDDLIKCVAKYVRPPVHKLEETIISTELSWDQERLASFLGTYQYQAYHDFLSECYQELNRLLQQLDYPNIHAAKGLASNLGMSPLTAYLEKALQFTKQEHNVPETLIQDIMTGLVQFNKDIQQLS